MKRTERVPITPNPKKVAVVVPVKDDPSILGSLPYLSNLSYPDLTVAIVDDSTNRTFESHLKAGCEKRGFVYLKRPKGWKGRKGAAINYAFGRSINYKDSW